MVTKPKTDKATKRNVVKLAVHKNTLAKRKCADARRLLRSTAKQVGDMLELDGFVLVGIAKNGECAVRIEPGPLKPRLLSMWLHEKVTAAVEQLSELDEQAS